MMIQDLKALTPLLEQFIGLGKKEKFKKGDILLREGKVCRKLFFIEKGILRFYYINKDGQDITHWFLLENDFITEINSFIKQAESEYYLEVLEDCTLISCTFEDYQKISNISLEINQISNAILINFLLEFGEKIKDLQFRDAKTRYDNLLKKYPAITQRVALKHIASYLGITQQSLSRIRKISP